MPLTHRHRVVESLSDRVRRGWALRYLARRSAELGRQRRHRMAVYAHDWIGIGIYLEGVYERLQLESLVALVDALTCVDRSRIRVLDVGANIGNHALFFAQHFGSVLAFEPHPEHFQLLAFNARPYPNLQVFNFGLGAETGTAILSDHLLNSGGASMVYSSDTGPAVQVDVRALDESGVELGDCGLIKLDVEGMEHAVLLGARRTLAHHQPIVVLEQLRSDFASEDGRSPAIRLLESLGYTFVWLEGSGERPLTLWARVKMGVSYLFHRGIRHRWLTDQQVPVGTYSMLVALPERLKGQLVGLLP